MCWSVWTTTSWASLIEIISSCATSQDPLRQIRPQRTVNRDKSGSSDGMDSKTRNPSAHALLAEGQQRRVVRERVASVWLLSTVSDSLLSRTFASFWYVKGECLICEVHNRLFLSQSLNCFWCFKWEKRSVTPPSGEEAKRGERNLLGVNECVSFSWVDQYSAARFPPCDLHV